MKVVLKQDEKVNLSIIVFFFISIMYGVEKESQYNVCFCLLYVLNVVDTLDYVVLMIDVDRSFFLLFIVLLFMPPSLCFN